MKLFLKNIIVFSVLPVLGMVVLFYLNYDKSFAWNFIEGDCGGHGNWVWNRIYNNPKPIDVAFIGSSAIIAGINDQVVEDSFQNQTNLDMHFTSLGYCRFGRNMSYVILKELLEEREVKYIVVEARFDEDRSSHPMFPYLADSEDVLKPPWFLNQSFLPDIYLASIGRVEYWKQQILYEKKSYPNDDNPFGHASSKAIADPNVLEEFRQRRIEKEKHPENAFVRTLNLSYPRSYLEKINQLCEVHDAELLFLYLPAFGAISYPPKELQTYEKYGPVLMPPSDIFENKNHWADEIHINNVGSEANSFWFANEFTSYLEKRKTDN